MNRRSVLKSAAALSAAPWLSMLDSRTAHAGDETAGTRWWLGWRGVDVDSLAPLELTVDGELPAAVQGSLYRNGAARLERGGVRYQHWFDGDGMVQRFRIGADTVVHDARFIQTDKYLEEQAAGRFLYPGAGTAIQDARPGRNSDSGNVANTSLLPFQDELLALWEGGSAYRIDPDTLETLGRKDWRNDLKHMPFSAHPLRDTDGTLWNVGSAPYAGRSGTVFIYRIDASGEVVAAQPVATPIAGYMHSFTMSERYLVFYIGPHLFEHGARTFVDSFSWQPDQGSRLLVVDKNDLTVQRWFDAPAGFTFHCANAYDQGDSIVAHLSLYADPGVMQSAMFGLLDETRGTPAYPEFARGEFATIALNLNSGRVHVESTDVAMEFPGTDGRGGYGAGPVFGTGHQDASAPAFADTVVRIDPTSGRTEHAAMPRDHIVEEPLFVPGDSAKPGDGWLVGTFLDLGREQSGIYVLNANRLADGPVAMARMERTIPLGFHGCFMASSA